jgi:acyl-CoA thioesterase
MMESRIFTKDGLLIATCTQEGFYVLKRDPRERAKTKTKL